MDPKLQAAQSELSRRVMNLPGVTGTAIGEKKGRPCLVVYLSDSSAGSRIPRSVGGYPVKVEVTGPFKRL